MRVEAIKQANQNGSGQWARIASPADATEAVAESRALTVTVPAVVPEPRSLPRQAAFLAHLIATKTQAPQTRERRRAEPREAIAAYRATAALLRA
jgi:hypothetical protein